jgi:hypothetical protein
METEYKKTGETFDVSSIPERLMHKFECLCKEMKIFCNLAPWPKNPSTMSFGQSYVYTVTIPLGKIETFKTAVENFFMESEKIGEKNPNFPREVTVGGLSYVGLIRRVLDTGYEITSQAKTLLEKGFDICAEYKTVKLKCITPLQMGFTEELVPWEKIRKWIKENGALCDDELPLRLRLSYDEQPDDEGLYISNDYPYFRVANYGNTKSVFRNGMDACSDGENGYPNYAEFVYYSK